MADSPRPPDRASASRLEADLERILALLRAESEATREALAAESTETRAAIRQMQRGGDAAPRKSKVTLTAPGEKAEIDQGTEAVRKRTKAETETARAVKERLALEQQERQILLENAALVQRMKADRPRIEPSEQLAMARHVETLRTQATPEAILAAERVQAGITGAAPAPSPAARALASLRDIRASQSPWSATARQPAEPPRQPGGYQMALFSGGEDIVKTNVQIAETAKTVAVEQGRAGQAISASGAGASSASTQMRALALSSELAADSAARHGYLTSETIQYMLKGQLTAKQLGNEMLGTIAKFGGWTAAATAVYSAVGALSQLYKGALESASGVGLVQRIINNVDTTKLQQSFRDLSEQFNLPIEDVVQAVYGSSKVFNDQADAVSAASSALFAMKVGELSAAESTQYLTAIVNGFGLSAAELPDVFDAINQAQNKFGGNTGQLIAGVAKASGVFRLAGGNYKELIGLIETGTKVTGASGESVGTAISRSVSRVLTPQGATALRGVGITPGGPYMEILKQAFEQAKSASPSQVNAIARALVPQGGQFARILVPILENRRMFDKIINEMNSDRVQGSASRELSRALSQPDEQIKALVNGVQRLGSALAELGVGSGLGVLVKSLNIALTLTTHFLDLMTKIPGVDVAAPFVALGVELAGVVKLMRYFNVGGTLAAGRDIPQGSIRSLLLGAATQKPDAEMASRIEKDQVAVQRLSAEEAARANLVARRAIQQVQAAEGALVGMEEGTAEYEAQLRRINRLQDSANEQTIRAAQLQGEITALQAQTNEYLRLRKTGMEAEQAAIKSGIWVVSPTKDYGKGGTPQYLGQEERAGQRAGQMALFDAGAAGGAAAGQIALFDAEKAGTGAAAKATEAEEALAAKRLQSAEATGLAATAETAAAGGGLLRAMFPTFTRAPRTAAAAEAALAGEGLLGGAALRTKGLLGRTAARDLTQGLGIVGLEEAGPGIASRGAAAARSALATKLPYARIVAPIAVGMTAKDLYDYYNNQGKQIEAFSKAADTGNLKKAIAMGDAQLRDSSLTLGGAVRDVFALRFGHLFHTATQAVGDAILHAAGQTTDTDVLREGVAAVKGQQAHIALAQGQGVTKAQRKELIQEQLLNIDPLAAAGLHDNDQAQTEAKAIVQGMIDKSRQRGRQGKGTLLTQSQIRQQAKEAMAGATTTAEQIAVYQKEIDEQVGSFAAVLGGKTAKAASSDTINQARAGMALVKAEAGNLTELAKVLDSGALATDDAITNLNTQLALHGLTRKTLGEARTDIGGPIRDLGIAIQNRDPAGQKKAIDKFKGISDSVDQVAQQNLSDRLAVATTPGEKAAARKLFLQEIGTSVAGLREILRTERAKVIADNAALPGARTYGHGADTRIQSRIDASNAKIAGAQALLNLAQPDRAARIAEQARDDQADAFAMIDAKASLAISKVPGDPTAQARITLNAIHQKLAWLAKTNQKGGVDWINLLAQANQQQTAIVNTAVADYDRAVSVAEAKFAVSHGQGDILAKAVNDAYGKLGFLSSQPKGTVTKDQWADAYKNLYGAEKANADYLRQQAQAMTDARYAYAEAGTNDPVRTANLQVQNAAADVKYAQTPADRLAARARLRSARRDQANTRWQGVADTIDYNLSMDKITNDTAAAEYESLARHVKNNKALYRQFMERAHQLRKEAEDGGPQELNVGSIKFPTAYEVMRGIGQASKASSRSLSTGNVHATANATINVNVANKGDVGAVSDAIDTVLTTHVRSTLRAKGVLGG